MNIVVNTRLLLSGRLEGIGWFTYETLKRITSSHPEHKFIFIFDRKYDEKFIFNSNVIPVVAAPQARHPFLYYLWFEHSIPHILKKYKADLFLSPDGYLSLKTKVKSLPVIHDLNFEQYPQDLPYFTRKYYKYFFPKFAAKAARIATVSEFSANDISEKYNIDPMLIDVVYDGVNENFRPLNEIEIQTATARFTDNKPYFIFIGALHPRKNLKNLFLAFDAFKQKHHCDIKLLIVGEKKWWTKDIKYAYENLYNKNDVVFSGRLNDYDLNLALGGALACTYVSYFEGFGIPIIESFKCNVPVITSDVTSMPEIAGDAACFCNPFDVNSIANAMGNIYKDINLRDELVRKGKERLKLFSWDRTSDLLWKSISKTLQ